MEYLISDKGAMDPEVVIPGVAVGEKTMFTGLNLWLGLPQTWALGTFVVCSIAMNSWPYLECVVGLTFAIAIFFLRDQCRKLTDTMAGAWLLVLHHCCCLAGLVVGVRSTLQYMAGHSSWLNSQMALCPNLGSLAVLLFIITLHALGLERSRILRWGLLVCIPVTIMMLYVGMGLSYNVNKINALILQPLSLNKFATSTAFFSLVFSNWFSLNLKSECRQHWVPFVPLLMMVMTCSGILGFIYLARNDRRDEGTDQLLFFHILEKGLDSSAWPALRSGLAVTSMTSLSLSLVELVTEVQRRIAGVAGVILPPSVARDHWWTGTQLSAITITGLVSAVLLFLPLKSIISLASAAYLLSQACDITFTVYRYYQPSFVPKNSGTESDGSSYQLLPIDGDTDNETELSGDSGHSSDTDIDAAVHEYKETVKVVKMMVEPRPLPTVHSARIVIFLMTALVASSFCMAGAIEFGFMKMLIFFDLVVLCVIYEVSRQPHEADEGRYVANMWWLCTSLALQLMLASLLIPQIWAPLAIWVCLGLMLWLVQKRRYWWRLQTQLSRHADRVRLPRGQLAQSFQPSYHKLSTLDTVHIVR